MKQGEEDIKEDVKSVHRVFRESILAAEAKVEQRLLDQAIGTDPIGARWYLSRKFRKDYGDKVEVEHSGDIELVFVDDEDADMPQVIDIADQVGLQVLFILSEHALVLCV